MKPIDGNRIGCFNNGQEHICEKIVQVNCLRKMNELPA